MNSWLCSTLVLLSRNCVGKKCRNLSAGVSLFSLFAFSALNVHCCRPVFFSVLSASVFHFYFIKLSVNKIIQTSTFLHIQTHMYTHVRVCGGVDFISLLSLQYDWIGFRFVTGCDLATRNRNVITLAILLNEIYDTEFEDISDSYKESITAF